MDYCKIEIQQNAEAENKFNGTCNNFTSFAHRNAVQGKWQQQEEGVLNEVVQEEKRYRRSSPLAYRLSSILFSFIPILSLRESHVYCEVVHWLILRQIFENYEYSQKELEGKFKRRPRENKK